MIFYDDVGVVTDFFLLAGLLISDNINISHAVFDYLLMLISDSNLFCLFSIVLNQYLKFFVTNFCYLPILLMLLGIFLLLEKFHKHVLVLLRVLFLSFIFLSALFLCLSFLV